MNCVRFGFPVVWLSLLAFAEPQASAAVAPVSPPAGSAAPGPFGLGIALVHPTGLSANYDFAPFRSLAAALGWGSHSFQLHIDHIWYRETPFIIDKVPLSPYVGVGGRLQEVEHKYKDDRLNIGLRVPLGVAYRWRMLQAFGEIAPALNMVEETSVVVDLTIGGRYYF